jgi:hypothetical protein
MPSKLVMAIYALLIEKSATLSSRHRAEASVALVSAVLGSRNRPYLEVHKVVVAIPGVGTAHINLEDAEGDGLGAKRRRSQIQEGLPIRSQVI